MTNPDPQTGHVKRGVVDLEQQPEVIIKTASDELVQEANSENNGHKEHS